MVCIRFASIFSLDSGRKWISGEEIQWLFKSIISQEKYALMCQLEMPVHILPHHETMY